MRARLIGVAALALALSAGASQAGEIPADVKAPPAVTSERAASVALPLAERVEALVRGKNLKPGVSTGIANAEGTVQLTVTELDGGRMVRLINLSTNGLMGEWHLSAATPHETDNTAAVVLMTMGMVPPDGLGNAPVSGATVHVH